MQEFGSVTSPPSGPGTPGRDLSGVRIPMLISGIFQCLTALGWFSMCITFPLGIPLLVLGIFELVMFGKLAGSREEQDIARGKAKTYAILDVCSILLLNLPSMVCGIVQLANHRQFDE